MDAPPAVEHSEGPREEGLWTAAAAVAQAARAGRSGARAPPWPAPGRPRPQARANTPGPHRGRGRGHWCGSTDRGTLRRADVGEEHVGLAVGGRPGVAVRALREQHALPGRVLVHRRVLPRQEERSVACVDHRGVVVRADLPGGTVHSAERHLSRGREHREPAKLLVCCWRARHAPAGRLGRGAGLGWWRCRPGRRVRVRVWVWGAARHRGRDAAGRDVVVGPAAQHPRGRREAVELGGVPVVPRPPGASGRACVWHVATWRNGGAGARRGDTQWLVASGEMAGRARGGGDTQWLVASGAGTGTGTGSGAACSTGVLHTSCDV